MLGLANLFFTALFLIISGLFTFGIVPIIYLILVLVGNTARIDRAKTKLRTNLMKEEETVSLTVQCRLLSTVKRRTLILITNSRCIIMYRKLLGGYKTVDFQWKNLIDVTITESIFPGLFGSNIKFEYVLEKKRKEDEKNLSVLHYGFPSQEATRIYSYAQAQEQAWEEKRRVRGMEEMRAMSGGIQLGNFPPTVIQQQPQAPTGSAFIGELVKAKQLLDTGIISDAEYQEIKSKLLSQGY